MRIFSTEAEQLQEARAKAIGLRNLRRLIPCSHGADVDMVPEERWTHRHAVVSLLASAACGDATAWSPDDTANVLKHVARWHMGDVGEWQAQPGRVTPAGNFLVPIRQGDEVIGAFACETREKAEERSSLAAAAPDLRDALTGLGALPEGYCFCVDRDATRPDAEHTGECRAARAALRKAGVKL